MRLGARPTTITPKHPNGEASLATDVYGIEQGVEASVLERHRHRYEVNNNLKDQFERKGLIFSGMSPDNKLPEIIELENHPWFIGCLLYTSDAADEL